MTKAELRRQLRRRRMALTDDERRNGEARVVQRLLRHPVYRNARSIAVYDAMGSELDLSALTERALGDGRRVAFPRVRGTHMDMHDARQIVPGWALSVILMPLVGFDASGHRLGQGGGFYDRYLARLRCRRPWLIGIAFDEQQADALPCDPWDVPLDGVVTPSRWHCFHRMMQRWPTGC